MLKLYGLTGKGKYAAAKPGSSRVDCSRESSQWSYFAWGGKVANALPLGVV